MNSYITISIYIIRFPFKKHKKDYLSKEIPNRLKVEPNGSTFSLFLFKYFLKVRGPQIGF